MLRTWLYLSSAMLFVGSSAVTGKLALQTMPLHQASLLRFVMATCILLPLLYWREGAWPSLSKHAWLVVTLQALCGSFLFNLLLLTGLSYTSASYAGLLTSATPAFMLLFGVLLFKERYTLKTWVTIALGMIGLIILSLGEQLSVNQFSVVGCLLILMAVACECIFLLLRKKLPSTLSSLALASIICLINSALFLPGAIYEYVTHPHAPLTLHSVLVSLYYGGCITAGAYLLWFAGMARASTSMLSLSTALMPVSALLLAWLLLGEPIYPLKWIGTGCILISIVLHARSSASA